MRGTKGSKRSLSVEVASLAPSKHGINLSLINMFWPAEVDSRVGVSVDTHRHWSLQKRPATEKLG